MDIDQITHANSEIPRCPLIRHFHMTPGFVCVEKHEQIGFYNWYEVGTKDQNLLIQGQLFEKDSSRFGANRWFYNEELFEHGLKISESQNVCDKTG
jgi:hypothetical protein